MVESGFSVVGTFAARAEHGRVPPAAVLIGSSRLAPRALGLITAAGVYERVRFPLSLRGQEPGEASTAAPGLSHLG